MSIITAQNGLQWMAHSNEYIKLVVASNMQSTVSMLSKNEFKHDPRN